LSPVFRDREELASATDLGAVISEALRESSCQIVICSPAAAKSRWVNEEILAFKRLGREDRILCLIIAGEPNASDDPARAAEECFPPALRFRLDADGNLSDVRTEPIAADARAGKDGKSHAKLKLIAGVLGVGFDTLRRREQQRRTRRLIAFSTAATVGMVVTSGLAAYAVLERRAAERQTVRAEAEAETARQTTGFLVDLFRISDPSEARGNAVTAREMLDKGAARIDHELAGQPEIRATLMDTLGTVYTGLGLFRQARPLLDNSVRALRGRPAADPLAMSLALEHMGDLMTLQADFDAAEKAYREAIAIQSSRPHDSYSQAELSKSLHGLGTLLDQKGRYPEADQTLRRALELQRGLPNGSQGDVARTLKDLARVIAEEGDLNGAIPVMRSAVAMQRQLRGTEPHPDLSEALNDLALLLYDHGDYDEAERLFVEAIAMEHRLVGDKHPELATYMMNLGAVLQGKRELVRAEATYRQALAMSRDLLGDVHPDIANALQNLVSVQMDRGDIQGAITSQREALAVLRKLFPGDHPEVARAGNRLGFLLTEADEYAEADRILEESLAMRRRLEGENHPDVGTSLIHLAILQVARHEYEAALTSARSAVQILTPALSATHWKTAVGESAEGAALSGLGRYGEGEPLLVHSLGILTQDGGAPAEYQRLAQHYLDELRVHARARARVRPTEPVQEAALAPRGP
jgi:tetratricopeptide (TPR) repeat protein